MAEGVPGVGDGPVGASPGPPAAGANPGPTALGRKRWRRARWLGLSVGVVLLVALPSLYVLTQQESRVTEFTLRVTTSCPGGVWQPPSPGEHTGACDGIQWLQLPVVSSLSGIYAASNSSPVWVVVDFVSQSYNSTTSAGAFALTGVAAFSWASAPSPFGPGDYRTGAAFVVVSNYPITVTIEGRYTSPQIA